MPPERLSAGVAVKVLSLLDADGAADIFTHVEKLSEEIWRLPEQVVSLVFEVIVPVDIVSLKITATVVAGELKVELSSGLTEATVGSEVSITNELIFIVTEFPRLSIIVILQSE